jgi:hypothetical protein
MSHSGSARARRPATADDGSQELPAQAEVAMQGAAAEHGATPPSMGAESFSHAVLARRAGEQHSRSRGKRVGQRLESAEPRRWQRGRRRGPGHGL